MVSTHVPNLFALSDDSIQLSWRCLAGPLAHFRFNMIRSHSSTTLSINHQVILPRSHALLLCHSLRLVTRPERPTLTSRFARESGIAPILTFRTDFGATSLRAGGLPWCTFSSFKKNCAARYRIYLSSDWTKVLSKWPALLKSTSQVYVSVHLIILILLTAKLMFFLMGKVSA
jgi:hypothetical protein